MFWAPVTGNKILVKRQQLKERRIHIRKLWSIKPQIDSRRPTSYNHLAQKAKKEQQLEDWFTEIERENWILLEKMTSIMQQKNQNKTVIGFINASQSV